MYAWEKCNEIEASRRWLRVWTLSHVRLRWMTICCKWSLYLVSQLLRDLYHLEKEQGQKDLLDTEFLNFRYCLNVTIFKYLIPINQLPDLGY